MFNSIFKIVYFIEVMVISIVRGIGTAKYKRLKVEVDRKTAIDMIFLGLNGIGMIVPFVYVFSSVLDFADYELPDRVGWAGAVLFGVATWLLWRTHAGLGRNWTPTLGIRSGHKLITGGVFKYMRHPMYTAHLIWAVAQIMILHNWIAGYSFIIVQAPFLLLRIRDEEKMMLEQFGEEYGEYMKRTGRLFPLLKRNK